MHIFLHSRLTTAKSRGTDTGFLGYTCVCQCPRQTGDHHITQQTLHQINHWKIIERGEKTPTPKISALLRKRPVLLRAHFVLTKDRKRPYYPDAESCLGGGGLFPSSKISGRFRKRVVLANVPSFRFRSGGTCERTLVPVFIPGEHPNVPSFRFSFRGNVRQNHPFGNHPFANPRKKGHLEKGSFQKYDHLLENCLFRNVTFFSKCFRTSPRATSTTQTDI